MKSISSLQSELWDKFELYSVEVRTKYLGSEHNYSHFYSALDSIQDMVAALHEFSHIKRTPTLLECLGFLQCLVIQQDAVLLLCKIFNLDWEYDSEIELVNIRDIRNRIVGHPNKASKKGMHSTAFFPSQGISSQTFSAVIQYKNKKWDTIFINFSEYIEKNDCALVMQLETILVAAVKVEKKMFKAQPYDTYVGGIKQKSPT